MRPRHVRLIPLLAFVLLVLAALVVGSAQADEKKGEKQTVYVTKTGTKYHADGCKFLAKSKIATSLEDAKKKYSACSVCNPPK